MESTCAVCGKTAQSVELAPPAESPAGDPLQENERLAPFARFLRGEGGTLVTTGVNGEAAFPLPVERAAVVRSAIERNDWPALFAINREWDPSWCRECGCALLRRALAPECRVRRRITTTAPGATARRGTGGSSMTEPPSDANIRAILSFLPVLESPGFAFGEMVAPPGQFGYARMAPEVEAFMQALYDNGWVEPFDWSEFQDEAIGYFENPSRLETADLETIRKFLTLHVRKDRFCEGHFLEMLKAGHIQAILRRLATLHG